MSGLFQAVEMEKKMLVDIHLATPAESNQRATMRVQHKISGDFDEALMTLAANNTKVALALTQSHAIRWTGEGGEELVRKAGLIYALLMPRCQASFPPSNELTFYVGLITCAFDGHARRVVFDLNKGEVSWSNWDDHFDRAEAHWEDDPSPAIALDGAAKSENGTEVSPGN